MARTAALANLYLDFTVTDAAYSNPRFLGSDVHLISINSWGGAPTYPVVVSWGALEKGDAEGSVTVTFAAGATWVPANSSVHRRTVAQWFRELNLRDVAVSILQWNEESDEQISVWTGFISHVEALRVESGVPVLDLLLTSSSRDMELTPVSDMIEKAGAFVNAPLDSVGRMVPVHYGDIPNRLSAGTPRNSVGMVGYPMSGVRALVVAENPSNQSVTVRVAKNDGSVASGTFVEPVGANVLVDVNLEPQFGDLWVYEPSLASYGMLDANSYTPVNDAAKVECDVSLNPRIYFFVKPSVPGSTLASGFASSIGKLSNADISDYVESTTTDYIWSFNCPEIPFPGTIRRVGVLVDWLNNHATKNRAVRFGLFDIYASGGITYLNNLSTLSPSRPAVSSRILHAQQNNLYDMEDFTHHSGTDTNHEARSGHFVTRNASSLDATLEVRCEVDDLGGADSGRDGVRLYHLILFIEVEYPKLATRRVQVSVTTTFGGIPVSFPVSAVEDALFPRTERENQTRSREIHGIDFFGTGAYQKDDASGTYTGSASAPIERPCDIANHLLNKRFGKTRNVATGTLGNFVDARDTILANVNMLASFGPDEVKRGGAIDMLNRTMPMAVFED